MLFRSIGVERVFADIKREPQQIGIDWVELGGSLHSVNLVLGCLHHDRRSHQAYDLFFRLQIPHLILNSQDLIADAGNAYERRSSSLRCHSGCVRSRRASSRSVALGVRRWVGSLGSITRMFLYRGLRHQPRVPDLFRYDCWRFIKGIGNWIVRKSFKVGPHAGSCFFGGPQQANTLLTHSWLSRYHRTVSRMPCSNRWVGTQPSSC